MDGSEFDAVAARIRASFAQQSMMATLGAGIEEVAPGYCRIGAAIAPGLRQQHGVAHAGLAFSIGDSAAGYAALSRLGPEEDVVTAEMKINLLAPAQGERLVAEGRVVRAGRRLIVVTAEVRAVAKDGAERAVALLQGTIVPVPAAG
ncbi:PaaI family thioesterase [Limimaricola pyoseonensis]|uniref:Uncharacterized domain 1-containing protein n=1 Tax=Limimaricola pyoseonensis TaxID=521013 RepID=A0A1G7AZM3_9RHOB|nr:PaaI family thioesterase [Limimaricola pyoseonensis]SDE20037.1 uncharacterized domain 1-containing protein [Limimaricola pyoseonensis]